MKRTTNTLLSLLLLLSLTACQLQPSQSQSVLSLEEVPAYEGEAYVELEGNVPSFTQEELESFPVEEYSPLDLLGRCGVARATVGLDTMPTEERGEIGQVKPSGWHTVRYDDLVEGKYLYNRCHLIGYQLTGENANEENLITGTRYLNVDGMLPFENEVADYVEDTGNHVYYQVTPIFADSELVARGVQMEALSLEDGGEGVCFNVYVYNVQPGVVIDYATGESWLEGEEPAAAQPDSSSSESQSQESSSSQQEPSQSGLTYILNNNTMRFHLPDCSSVASMKPQNREETGESREALIEQGYQPCGQCKP